MAMAASKVLSSVKLSLYAPAFVSSSRIRCLLTGGVGAGVGAGALGAVAFFGAALVVFFAGAFFLVAGFFAVGFFAVGMGPPNTSVVSITACWALVFDTNLQWPIELFCLSHYPPGKCFGLWVVPSGF